jgi:CBS-domain-containing membrane protein
MASVRRGERKADEPLATSMLANWGEKIMDSAQIAIGLPRLHQLTAGDLISGEIIVVQSTDTMHQAACKLAEQSVGLAPVVDEAGRCVGVISSRDFIAFEVDRTGDALPAHAKQANLSSDATCMPWDSVARFMATAVQTVSFDLPMRRICEIMLAEHIHHLIVLDEQTKPIGVVSTLDVISALLAICDEEQARNHEQR